jgi:hypothetical protein
MAVVCTRALSQSKNHCWDIIACLLNNSVSLQRTQALVPVGSFHCFFISVKLLPALARSATKSCTLVIPELCQGGQRITFSGWVYRSTAEFPVKTGLIKLALHTSSFISSLDNELQKLKWRELQNDLHLFVFTPCIYSNLYPRKKVYNKIVHVPDQGASKCLDPGDPVVPKRVWAGRKE